jgi:hypothetical protein
MPTIQQAPNPHNAAFPRMSVQTAPVGGPPLRQAAIGLWLLLLILGLYSLIRINTHRPLKLFLAAVIGGQLTLHLLYGNETFLYSLHFLPLLVLAASASALTSKRRLAVGVAAVLTVLALLNNVHELNRAHRYFESFQMTAEKPDADAPHLQKWRQSAEK